MSNGSTYVKVIKVGSDEMDECHFYDLKAGDTFFVGGNPYTVGEEAHESGDASYDGYLLYDTDDNGWFPEDLDDE